MDALARFEEFVEQLVEGSFSQFFRAPLEPIELAKKLERVMRTRRTVSIGRTFVPNQYHVSLNPGDFAGFKQFRKALEGELAGYVAGVAQEQGYSFWGPVSVTLEPDEAVQRRRVRISTAMSDEPAEQPEAGAEGPEQTVALPVDLVRAAASRREAWLVAQTGHQAGICIPLDRELVRLGRALDNDFVVEDPRVSRHHARIERSPSGLHLVDQRSANGMSVNGQPVAEHWLVDGDRISLGGWELGFHEEPSRPRNVGKGR